MAVEDSVAQTQIRAFVERVERLDEELKAINDDKKEIFAEARGNGFDVPALKQVIKIRRQDANERMERETIVELYMSALGMIETPDFDEPRVHVQVRVREAAPKTAPAPTEITEQQAAPQPASDLTVPPSPQGQVASIQESPRKAAEAEGESPSTQDGGAFSAVKGANARLENAVGVEPSPSNFNQPDTVAEGEGANHSVPASGESPVILEPAGGENVAGEDDAQDEEGNTDIVNDAGKSVGALASAAPAPITYPAPGVVVMEHTPPEGAIAHPYATCWPVKIIDAAGGVREPIVKIGKLILDGRGRMFAARGVDGGKGIEYPVVQYDGTDPLMDCIRWNLVSRPSIDPHNMKMIAGKLARMEPTRADDIMQAFGLEMAEAAQ